jgi:hypothetical protein
MNDAPVGLAHGFEAEVGQVLLQGYGANITVLPGNRNAATGAPGRQTEGLDARIAASSSGGWPVDPGGEHDLMPVGVAVGNAAVVPPVLDLLDRGRAGRC